MGNKFTINAWVEQATKEEMLAGFLRISENLRHEIRNGDYIQLTTNNRTIYCQVRGTPNKIDTIKINEWYRELLGINIIPDTKIEFEIDKVSFFRILRAFQYHPDRIIRISLGLGLTSVGLGILGIALGLISTYYIKSANIVIFYTIIFIVLAIVIILFILGFSLFAGKVTQTIKKPQKTKRK